MTRRPPWICRHLSALLAAGLLFGAPAFAQPGASAETLDVERSGRPQSPVRDPLAAWQRALAELPAGTRVRRLAFADHVLFVFHSVPGEARIRSLTLTPTSDGFVVEDAGERDASLCAAEGVDAQRVESALLRVLDSAEWDRHARRMDTLILECMTDTLAWTLMPVPAGGYVEGVAIPTLSLPFEPAPEQVTPALERD